MKRLLLIAYHFPPEPASGALRPGYLAKYLPEFGWDVTVLTRRLPLLRAQPVIEANVWGERFEHSVRQRLGVNGSTGRVSPFRRLLRHMKESLFFPDRTAGWIVPAVRSARKAAPGGGFDAVLSTAMPASAHVAGGAIAALYRLPWIADYRDLWFGNPTAPQRSRLRRSFERHLERALMSRVSAIVTVSQPLADRLAALHRTNVAVIPNAFDPADWKEIEALQPRAFELCFTGSMYDGARTPALLFEALAALRDQGDPAGEARVHFYGPNSAHIGDLAQRYCIQANVVLHGTVPRSQALRAQRSASDLLIFLNMDRSTRHELGSKIFEYAGAQRPILAFGPRGSVVRDYLDRHRLGWFSADLSEATAALRAAHRRFLCGEHAVVAPPDAVLDARNLARSFAAVLERIG